ncbi:hypothetical protein ACI3ER_11950 [Bacillus sp. Wb]
MSEFLITVGISAIAAIIIGVISVIPYYLEQRKNFIKERDRIIKDYEQRMGLPWDGKR